jgi:hypothetical protein
MYNVSSRHIACKIGIEIEILSRSQMPEKAEAIPFLFGVFNFQPLVRHENNCTSKWSMTMTGYTTTRGGSDEGKGGHTPTGSYKTRLLREKFTK